MYGLRNTSVVQADPNFHQNIYYNRIKNFELEKYVLCNYFT